MDHNQGGLMKKRGPAIKSRDGAARTTTLGVRVSPAELKEIEAVAQQRGMTVSDYVRGLCFAEEG